MAERSNFPFYFAWLPILEALDDASRGRAILAMARYAKDGTEPDEGDVMTRVVMAAVRQGIDKDMASWEAVCQKNAANGAKGGRPRKPTETQENPVGFLDGENKPTETLKTPTTTTTIIERKESTYFVGTKEKKFRRPTDEEVFAYFVEKFWPVDEAQRFFDYYESNGWRVGKNAMKDWKAAARNWMRNNLRTVNVPQRRKSNQEQLLEMIGECDDGTGMRQTDAGILPALADGGR